MFVTVKARVYTDATGVYTEIPALLTPAGVLEPLLDYCLARSHDRSLTWMSKVSRSVRMFLEYLQTNPAERDTYRLFQNFAQRLYTGTFDRETGLDPSGLCWAPRSPQDAGHIITHLTDFFDWLGEMRPEAAKVNPRYAGGAFDRQADEAAYQYRRSRAFLGHTWAANASPAETGHRVRSQRLPKVEKGEPPAFPEARFEELLVKGFRAAGRQDYRGMLITLLLHGAGFRESEPLHLYITDVFPDPATPRQALVRIHHPSYGAAPEDWRDERGQPRKGNRAEYLAQRFGLVPRTELMDSRHAGWKGGMHDGAYYNTLPGAGRTHGAGPPLRVHQPEPCAARRNVRPWPVQQGPCCRLRAYRAHGRQGAGHHAARSSPCLRPAAQERRHRAGTHPPLHAPRLARKPGGLHPAEHP